MAVVCASQPIQNRSASLPQEVLQSFLDFGCADGHCMAYALLEDGKQPFFQSKRVKIVRAVFQPQLHILRNCKVFLVKNGIICVIEALFPCLLTCDIRQSRDSGGTRWPFRIPEHRRLTRLIRFQPVGTTVPWARAQSLRVSPSTA